MREEAGADLIWYRVLLLWNWKGCRTTASDVCWLSSPPHPLRSLVSHGLSVATSVLVVAHAGNATSMVAHAGKSKTWQAVSICQSSTATILPVFFSAGDVPVTEGVIIPFSQVFDGILSDYWDVFSLDLDTSVSVPFLITMICDFLGLKTILTHDATAPWVFRSHLACTCDVVVIVKSSMNPFTGGCLSPAAVTGPLNLAVLNRSLNEPK